MDLKMLCLLYYSAFTVDLHYFHSHKELIHPDIIVLRGPEHNKSDQIGLYPRHQRD
jgi:hypothetical protein